MNDTAALLKRHKAWLKGRRKLSKAEGKGNYPSSTQWQNSDDEGIAIGEEAIEILRAKRKVWSLTVVGDEQPLTTTLHESEEAAVESLEVSHGDAVERESDIITDLEKWGYTITVDSHEI